MLEEEEEEEEEEDEEEEEEEEDNEEEKEDNEEEKEDGDGETWMARGEQSEAHAHKSLPDRNATNNSASLDVVSTNSTDTFKDQMNVSSLNTTLPLALEGEGERTSMDWESALLKEVHRPPEKI